MHQFSDAPKRQPIVCTEQLGSLLRVSLNVRCLCVTSRSCEDCCEVKRQRSMASSYSTMPPWFALPSKPTHPGLTSTPSRGGAVSLAPENKQTPCHLRRKPDTSWQPSFATFFCTKTHKPPLLARAPPRNLDLLVTGGKKAGEQVLKGGRERRSQRGAESRASGAVCKEVVRGGPESWMFSDVP